MSSTIEQTTSKGLRILYFGDKKTSSTSRHRADALCRMGHHVTICDIYSEVARNSHKLLSIFDYRTGYRRLQGRVLNAAKRVASRPFDLVWVNGGELLGRKAVEFLSLKYKKVVLYNNDDPFGSRDGRRFDSLKAAIPRYGLCVTVREANVREYVSAGAARVLRVWMSYDEVAHRPLEPAESVGSQLFTSDVSFAGAWMPERGPFMARLMELGIPIRIWGSGWNKAPEWPRLKSVWHGSTITGRDYVRAISGAKVCLGLLSKGNRDLHTRRSAEIPYAGGLLCAERTSEHLQMYKEGEEAVFWDSADECAQQCFKLLKNDCLRERVRLQGMQKVRALEIGNENVCKQILANCAENL